MRDPILVDVARDFTITPGGRYRDDGKWSGQEFREDKIEPLLDRGDSVIIDLDGPEGFTTSFLEEVFGGIIRKYGIDALQRVTIRAVRAPSRGDRALRFAERAIAKAKAKP